jgi:hypothetical protein
VSKAISVGKSGLSLDMLGKQIKVRIEKGDKAITDGKDHHITAGLDLAEAKDMIQMQDPKDRQYTWSEFCAKYCPVGQRRANSLISYANGTSSKADDDEAAKKRMSSKRAERSAQSEPDQEEDGDEAWAVKRFMFAVGDILDSAPEIIEYIGHVSLSEESADTLEAASEKIIAAWNEVKSAIKRKRLVKPAPKQLPPDKLTARQKRKADVKTYGDYAKQFGDISNISITPDVIVRMEDSLTSGFDDFADFKAEQERATAEYIREETQRRADMNAPLLAPITPEKEQAYTRLIKSRQLYEGACGLSWEEYFTYRGEHPDCTPLSRDELDYASMWTAWTPNNTARIAA